MEPVIVANTKFSIDLLKVFCKSNTGNVLFSPLNISSALGLVLLGAKGTTADQMYKALHFNKEKIMYHDLYKELNKGGENRSLKLFNHMFGERTLNFYDKFLDECKKWCFASLSAVDFKTSPEAARERINNWVEKKTEGITMDLLDQGDVTKDTKLALVSAMHFKDVWNTAFKRCDINKGEGLTVPMMYQTNRLPLGDIPEADSQILELLYEKNDLSMLIMLPNKNDGLPKLVDLITYEKIMEWTEPDHMISTEVHVEMPIFRLQEKYDLEAVLKELGITDVFSDKCDLSLMAPGPLQLSKVVDVTSVEVNEEGTEAKGASGGVLCSNRQTNEIRKSFIADHPFLFFIRHNPTKSILFWSRFIPQ